MTWLVGLLQGRLAASGPTGTFNGRVGDLHIALSGGIWLQRTHGVGLDRYLRYRLVESVILAVAEFEPNVRAALPEGASEDHVMRAVSGFAMTAYSTYDPERVTALYARGHSQFLYQVIRDVRTAPQRWPALLRLARTMGVPVEGGSAGDIKAAESLRQDRLRIWRWLREEFGEQAYRVLPVGAPIQFYIEP
jgi:hypothetical protein